MLRASIGVRPCTFGILLCATCVGASLTARADFTGAQHLPGQQYTFFQGAYNGSGVFAPGDPQFRSRPLSAAAVPGMANTLGVARQFGGVDFVNVNTGVATPVLQIPMAPYPWFDPAFNMIDDPLNPGQQVQGELYASGESGMLGVAFHPDFATNRKFYVSVTVQNPDGPYMPQGLGLDPTNGIDATELAKMNNIADPAGVAFRACFVCDHPTFDFPVAVGVDELPPIGVPDGAWGPECQGNWQKVHARNPTLMQIREYIAPVSGTVDSDDYRMVMSFERRFDFHNGGAIMFGPDGKMYLTSGDAQGTPEEGPFDNLGDSQPETPAHDFYGKILRIDVDGADAFPADDNNNYAIPANNPFVEGVAGTGTMTPDDDEVYAYGLRNPWAASFDPVTGDMWIGDVGYGKFGIGGAEEANVIPADSGGGQNFGWPRYEGELIEHAGGALAVAPDVDPEYFYSTTDSSRGFIIGGYVYRGSDPTLQGKYVYYEAGRREVWTYDPNAPVGSQATNVSHKIFDDLNGDQMPDLDAFGRPKIDGISVGLFAAFGQDSEGNLYLVSHSDGDIFQIQTGSFQPGDFNGDLKVDSTDIDLLADAAQNGGSLALYDLNGDSEIDFVPNASGLASDSDVLIRNLVDLVDFNGDPTGEKGTEYGDVNLDGQVFLSDLNTFATNYRQEGQFGWADGNINGSQEAGTLANPRVFLADLNALAGHWRFGVGTGSALEAVPEPSTWFLALTGVLAAYCRKSR